MKKLFIGLGLITVLGTFLPLLALAQPARVPHEDPTTVKGSLDKASLLLAYRDIFDLAALRQYADAQDMLGELGLADIPDYLRNIFDRYNGLSGALFASLDNGESLLKEASILLSNNQPGEAERKLDDARAAIQDAWSHLEETVAAAPALGDELAVSTVPATSQLRQAYNQLPENLERVRQLIDLLSQGDLKALTEKYQSEARALLPTALSLKVSPASAYIGISPPADAYPGLPFTIKGQVNPAGGSAGRTIRVTLDAAQLAEQTVPATFNLNLILPGQTPIGKHSLVVVVTPQGRYAGVSQGVTLSVSKMALQADIQSSRLLLTPGKVQVSGSVYRELNPVSNARVSLKFKNSSGVVRTSADGTFTASLEAPVDLPFIGLEALTVAIAPVEPWYASLEEKRQIFSVSLINTGLVLLGLVSIGLLVSKRRRKRPAMPQGSAPLPQTIETPALAPLPQTKHELTGVKSRILSTYFAALEAVRGATGITMTSPTTLREFLSAATPQLPATVQPFSELTAMAEVALYSARTLDETIASRAERLGASIKEGLRNGST